MNLAINFVWIGQKKLGWLECFMIYSWRLWGCQVNLFTHYPNGDGKKHTYQTLGLPPNICNIFDWPTLVEEDKQSKPDYMTKAREILAAWFAKHMPDWNSGGQQFTFNMADLCKSYLAATRIGIVLDLKIGPSPHIKKYVDSGIFSLGFIGCKRVNTIENQCMGSMSEDDTKRTLYGKGFEYSLFNEKFGDWKVLVPQNFKDNPTTAWFPKFTHANGRALGLSKATALKQGLQADWYDIGKYGRAKHALTLKCSESDVKFEGIGKEEEYGAIRIFKLEADQTNKPNSPRTTDEQRLAAQRLTFSELADASVQDGGIDVTAEGMPPIQDMLAMLSLTKKQ